jgi:RES domain-containing protein
VVYTSATASLAALEYLVHLDAAQAPEDLVLIPVEVPDDLGIQVIAASDLPSDWRQYPAPESLAQLGAEWARAAVATVLAVPSVIVPREANYLLNPRHPGIARLRIGALEPFSLDPRLWKASRPGNTRRRR